MFKKLELCEAGADVSGARSELDKTCRNVCRRDGGVAAVDCNCVVFWRNEARGIDR